MTTHTPKLIIHGGAGRAFADPSRAEIVRASLNRALLPVMDELLAGASSLDAVVMGCRLLEDDPIFNAGTGSAIQSDGIVRMSAALRTNMAAMVINASLPKPAKSSVGLRIPSNPKATRMSRLTMSGRTLSVTNNTTVIVNMMQTAMISQVILLGESNAWRRNAGQIRTVTIRPESFKKSTLPEPAAQFEASLITAASSPLGFPAAES